MFLLWADSADCPNVWVLLYIDVCFPCRLQKKTRFLKSFSLRPKYLGVHYFVSQFWKRYLMRGWLELQSPYGICPCLHAIFHPLHLLANLILLLPYTRFYISTHDCFSIRVVASLHVTRHACACWHCFIATQYLIQVCSHMSSDSAEHYCFWIISCIHIFAIRIFPI